jgi:acetyl-CoA C-acetyltransferase
MAAGRFADETFAVQIPQRKGPPIAFEKDEGVRGDTTAESIAKLKPAFDPAGSVTAANASSINDGAAALVIMSADKAKSLGV